MPSFRSNYLRSCVIGFICVLALGLACNPALGQQPFDFFWSVEEPGSGNVINEDLVVTLVPGESQTINLYFTTDGPSQTELRFGGGLEIETSDSGVMQFDGGEAFEFDIVTAGGTFVESRWGSDTGVGFVGTAAVLPDSLDMFDFFTILGAGIVNANTGPVLFDTGYDADADAFWIGSIEFTALSTGTVDLTTVVGDPISLTNDGFVALDPEFGIVTVNVEEPTTFVFEDGTLSIFGTDANDVIDVTNTAFTTEVVFNGDVETFDDVDEIVIESGAGADVITVLSLVRSFIFAGSGDDTVTVNGIARTQIFGEDGNDNLTGGTGPDVIEGGPGNDELNGRGGADFLDGGSMVLAGPNMNTILGGNGADTILGGEDVDIVFGGDGADDISTFGGDDEIDGGRGNDTINAADGDDMIAGNSGNDVIVAGNGNDIIAGSGGQDTISGGAGNDTITGGNASDIINGDSGNDMIQGNDGLDVISGGPGNDTIFGGRAADTISGGAGDDILNGQSENDTINGNGGNDTLTGGGGNDLLNGGVGIDEATDTGEQGEISIEIS